MKRAFLALPIAVGLVGCGGTVEDDGFDTGDIRLGAGVLFYNPTAPNEVLVMNDTGQIFQSQANSAGATSPGSQDNNGVVFTSLVVNGNEDIYRLRGTQAPARLTTDAGHDTKPAVSPDGSTVVFVSDRDGLNQIYVMDRGGQGQRRVSALTSPATNPSISFDNQFVLYQSTINGHECIIRVATDGSNLTRLTATNADDEYPAFSPTDLQIVFSSNRTGRFEIYRMSFPGTNQVKISNNADDALAPSYRIDQQFIYYYLAGATNKVCRIRQDATGFQTLAGDGGIDSKSTGWIF